MNYLVTTYKELYKDTRRWMRLVLKWFAASALVGGLTFFVIPDLLDVLLGVFEEKFGATPALDFNLVMGIFLNNLQASGIALIGGLLVGLGPFTVVVSNGFILGYILVSIPFLSQDHILETLGILAVGLIPHGILEIPAFLFAAAIGLKLGIEWLQKENYGRRLSVFGANLKRALWAVPVIVLALFLAALIEVYVSGKLVDLFA